MLLAEAAVRIFGSPLCMGIFAVLLMYFGGVSSRGGVMDESEFDKFADDYERTLAESVSLSGERPDFFAEYKIIDIARWCGPLSGALGTPPRVLDFGAGIGGSVPFVQKHLPGFDLTCLDVSRRSLGLAERRFPRMARFVHFDGFALPFPDNHFDVAFAACVFHHIPHDEHVGLLGELRRVLRVGGALFIFEHNPLNPLTVRVVNNCVFDKDAKLIRAGIMRQRMNSAGFAMLKTRYRIFFPNVLRGLRPAEPALSWLPMGGQYYVRGVK